jgi:hypothetical protein
LAVLLGSLAAADLHADTKRVQLLDLLGALRMAPNTETIAARKGFLLHDLTMGTDEAKAQDGDQVTALVSLSSFDGKTHPVQWIIRLKLAKRPSVNSPQAGSTDLIEYTNTGDSFTFHSGVSQMDLETLGRIADRTPPDLQLEVRSRGISVGTDFLCLDLTGAARTIAKVRESSGAGDLSVRPHSFTDDEVAAGRKFLATTKLTSDDVRSFAGSSPALHQFLDIVRSTPELQGILLQVLDKPSIIDVFRHGSSAALHIQYLGGGKSDGRDLFWNDGKATDFYVLSFNIEIFGKPALSVVFYLTPPTPPLEVSAGVVGIVAFSPSNPGKVVVVRVLSSAPGSNPIQSASSSH